MTSPDASTRDRLLDAAIALFARQGYSSTSVADIQQVCGPSPGSGAYLPIVQMLIRRNPGKLDADRFREAWLRLAEGAFTGVPPA
jgi:hypothetical protein